MLLFLFFDFFFDWSKVLSKIYSQKIKRRQEWFKTFANKLEANYIILFILVSLWHNTSVTYVNIDKLLIRIRPEAWNDSHDTQYVNWSRMLLTRHIHLILNCLWWMTDFIFIYFLVLFLVCCPLLQHCQDLQDKEIPVFLFSAYGLKLPNSCLEQLMKRLRDLTEALTPTEAHLIQVRIIYASKGPWLVELVSWTN